LYFYDSLNDAPWNNLSWVPSAQNSRAETGTKKMKLVNGHLISRELMGAGLLIDDMEKLSIRKRAGGEKMEIGGRHRSLKNLFQENATPAFLREEWPLFFFDEKLVYLPGLPAWNISAIVAPQFEAKAATDQGLEFEWHLQ